MEHGKFGDRGVATRLDESSGVDYGLRGLDHLVTYCTTVTFQLLPGEETIRHALFPLCQPWKDVL